MSAEIEGDSMMVSPERRHLLVKKMRAHPNAKNKTIGLPVPLPL